jgi:hypothetical protein
MINKENNDYLKRKNSLLEFSKSESNSKCFDCGKNLYNK